MSPTDLILGLHRALEELTENPPSSVPSPRETPKRASVALVVRVGCFLPADVCFYVGSFFPYYAPLSLPSPGKVKGDGGAEGGGGQDCPIDQSLIVVFLGPTTPLTPPLFY